MDHAAWPVGIIHFAWNLAIILNSGRITFRYLATGLRFGLLICYLWWVGKTRNIFIPTHWSNAFNYVNKFIYLTRYALIEGRDIKTNAPNIDWKFNKSDLYFAT